MNVMQIRTLGDPILREKARKVSRFPFDMQRIGMAMLDTMRAHAGAGLAAPQVGLPLRIIVVTQDSGEPLFLVNPEITEQKGEQNGYEACLSIPGFAGEVKRATNIKFKYQDLKGSKRKAKASDYFARLVQHEIDHLNGILFIDYIDASPK